MLGQRRRGWTNIKPAPGQFLVLASLLKKKKNYHASNLCYARPYILAKCGKLAEIYNGEVNVHVPDVRASF